jgi:hypothetical protein
MNVPIRVIGIATTFFWIFLIAIFATAAYSVKDLSLNFGEPEVSFTDSRLLFALPIHITNRGYYNIGNFNVTTQILNLDGYVLATGRTYERIIPKGRLTTVYHNVSLDFADLLAASTYLFNDTQFTVKAWVGLKLAEAIPVQAQTNFSFPWGAPFYNFALGTPTITIIDPVADPFHVRATVPMSFENHAAFDLVGNVSVRMLNSRDSVVGESVTVFSVPQNSPYTGALQFDANIGQVTPSGRFEVYFATEFFSHGPEVIPYG